MVTNQIAVLSDTVVSTKTHDMQVLVLPIYSMNIALINPEHSVRPCSSDVLAINNMSEQSNRIKHWKVVS